MVELNIGHKAFKVRVKEVESQTVGETNGGNESFSDNKEIVEEESSEEEDWFQTSDEESVVRGLEDEFEESDGDSRIKESLFDSRNEEIVNALLSSDHGRREGENTEDGLKASRARDEEKNKRNITVDEVFDANESPNSPKKVERNVTDSQFKSYA
ncbi:hypothetical protein L2E82_53860 [Cichorium intybus]|nr:hypothetical protein L2E82_53860 [Cichorium intybus]